ncbi:MAG TPA: hypothetical protein VMX17_11265 [Candidatus Glassbacteria bacterium]|nr:hypothetical protein [Candidatus Glassbacteria bacterium]
MAKETEDEGLKEFRKSQEDYFERYKRERAEALAKAGLTNLTEDQEYIISEPNDAPENYMCDGEISQKQAYSRWVNRLKQSGLSPAQVKAAIKFNFR